MLLVNLAHCVSVSTLQTARVLEKDDWYQSLGLAFYNSDDFLDQGIISIPLLEYTYRLGIWKNIDVGAKITNIGGLEGDLKYNLIDSDHFAMATGFGIGYFTFTSTVGTVETQSTIIDLILPVYLSYDVGEKVTLYSAAKYIFRSLSSVASVNNGDGSLASGTLGVQLGRESGVFIEGSVIVGLENNFTGNQFNTSYFFRF
jgi:hypothetical protein